MVATYLVVESSHTFRVVARPLHLPPTHLGRCTGRRGGSRC